MYIKINKNTTVISLETTEIDVASDELLIEITDEQFFEYQRFMRDFKKEYLFDAKTKQVSIFEYKTALVKFVQTPATFGTIENYDFRQEGVLYVKITETDPEYLEWLFLQSKQEKITDYLKKIAFNTSVEAIDTDTYLFEAKSGLNLLQGTFLQNENNDDFTLDFDATFYKEMDLAGKKALNGVIFPNDDAEWRNMYAILVAQSAINTEVQYQWTKAFKIASETVKNDDDLLLAYNDSKPSIFDRVKPITDAIFEDKLL